MKINNYAIGMGNEILDCMSEDHQKMFDECWIMPDGHKGKYVPVGFVAKLGMEIHPDIVGVDIGCGVINLEFEYDKEIDFEKLEKVIRDNIPTRSLREKAPFLPTEIKEKIKEFSLISGKKPCEYYTRQLGTLGGGNHFIELGKGNNGKYYLTIHTGSRKFGYDIAQHFSKQLSDKNLKKLTNKAAAGYIKNIVANNVDRSELQLEINRYKKFTRSLIRREIELEYLKWMDTAVWYANINRFTIADEINKLFFKIPITKILVIDCTHNYISQNIVRKGAISAREGEPVIIPLNMRDGIIIGYGKGNPKFCNSAPHGAGRILSRTEAKNSLKIEDFKKEMEKINTWSVTTETLDESPMAYKDMWELINAIADTVRVKEIIKPVYNFKEKK